MAEWGKGDERWIVQDREDGVNVNQWHWSEKDCLQWSRDRLKHLFENCTLVDAPGLTGSVTSVDSVEGEAFLNVRKKKLIPSYELSVKLSFKADVDGEAVHGQVCTTERSCEKCQSSFQVHRICHLFSWWQDAEGNGCLVFCCHGLCRATR